MNVVSIMAHQDDEMRCLGTMLKCRARGDRLFFVALTDGSKGMVQTPDMERTAAAAIRAAEMGALAQAAGAGYLCLDEPDEFLYDTPTVRLKLIEAIRATQADLIFTHYSEDYNLDHTSVHHLMRHCAMQACLPVLPTHSAPLKAPPAIFMVEPFGSIDFPATHYVDISDWHAEKIQLLLHHASQETAMQAAVGSGLETICTRLDAYRGDLVGCAYAEAFIPLRGRGTIKAGSLLP
jgi:LmbE family N-acetylglucosaminyl deacetylase